MMYCRCKQALLIFIIVFMFPAAGISEKALQEVEAGPIVIKSHSLEIDNNRKLVVFTGNVNAKRDDFTIRCQKMLLYYDDQSADKASGKIEIKIDKIVATGEVEITRASGGLATSDKAIYYQRDEKIVLTGKPVVKQDNDFVEGSKITLFLREKRSIVEGSETQKVRAVLFPRGEKGRSVVGE